MSYSGNPIIDHVQVKYQFTAFIRLDVYYKYGIQHHDTYAPAQASIHSSANISVTIVQDIYKAEHKDFDQGHDFHPQAELEGGRCQHVEQTPHEHGQNSHPVARH